MMFCLRAWVTHSQWELDKEIVQQSMNIVRKGHYEFERAASPWESAGTQSRHVQQRNNNKKGPEFNLQDKNKIIEK